MSLSINAVLGIADHELKAGESVIRITLTEPQSASHADYFTRFKVKIGRVDGSASSVTDVRCLVVKISSNTGVATVDETATCDQLPDIG